VISVFRHDVEEICALLGYYAALSGNPVPTFRDNLSAPSSNYAFVNMMVCRYFMTLATRKTKDTTAKQHIKTSSIPTFQHTYISDAQCTLALLHFDILMYFCSAAALSLTLHEKIDFIYISHFLVLLFHTVELCGL
jgi:hypothetical protein